MIQEKEVQKLFKNISDSIGKTSVGELNKNLNDFISKKGHLNDEENIVLKEVCDSYKVSSKVLMSKNVRGVIIDAKQTAYCILHNGLNLSMGYISSNIFRNNKLSVWRGIQRYKQANLKIASEKEFVENVDKLKCIILQKIQNQSV
jgi:hypothetical protein